MAGMDLLLSKYPAAIVACLIPTRRWGICRVVLRKGKWRKHAADARGPGNVAWWALFYFIYLFDLLELSPWVKTYVHDHVIDHVSPRHCFTLEGARIHGHCEALVPPRVPDLFVSTGSRLVLFLFFFLKKGDPCLIALSNIRLQKLELMFISPPHFIPQHICRKSGYSETWNMRLAMCRRGMLDLRSGWSWKRVLVHASICGWYLPLLAPVTCISANDNRHIACFA